MRLAMMPGASAVATQRKLQTTRQTLLKNQINARLKQIKIQIQQVDAAITEKVAQDEALSVTARRCCGGCGRPHTIIPQIVWAISAHSASEMSGANRKLNRGPSIFIDQGTNYQA